MNSCPKCVSKMITLAPHLHKCPKCDKRYLVAEIIQLTRASKNLNARGIDLQVNCTVYERS
jgi:tRNA(Ile2) C34 agmatinyltransferase TiaS